MSQHFVIVYLRVALYRVYLRYLERSLGREFYHSRDIVESDWLDTVRTLRSALSSCRFDVAGTTSPLESELLSDLRTVLAFVEVRLRQAEAALQPYWPSGSDDPSDNRENHRTAVLACHLALKCITSARLRLRIWQQRALTRVRGTEGNTSSWEAWQFREDLYSRSYERLKPTVADTEQTPSHWPDFVASLDRVREVIGIRSDIEKCKLARKCGHLAMLIRATEPWLWTDYAQVLVIDLHRRLLTGMTPSELYTAIATRYEYFQRFQDDREFRKRAVDPYAGQFGTVRLFVDPTTASGDRGQSVGELSATPYDDALDVLLRGQRRLPARPAALTSADDLCFLDDPQHPFVDVPVRPRAETGPSPTAENLVATILFCQARAQEIDLAREVTKPSRLYTVKNELLMGLKRLVEPAAAGGEDAQPVAVRPLCDYVFAAVCAVKRFPVPFGPGYESDYVRSEPEQAADLLAHVVPGQLVGILFVVFQNLVPEESGAVTRPEAPLCKVRRRGHKLAIEFQSFDPAAPQVKATWEYASAMEYVLNASGGEASPPTLTFEVP